MCVADVTGAKGTLTKQTHTFIQVLYFFHWLNTQDFI